MERGEMERPMCGMSFKDEDEMMRHSQSAHPEGEKGTERKM
jgi:uncharacterized C2H2 Zn-finger protein